MKNRLSPRHCFGIWLILFACINARGLATDQHQPAKESTYVPITVLGKDIHRRFIKPSEVAHNRAKLSEKDFARWQSESRWRPLVDRVSYLVTLDWAKQNNVRPTRAEIQEHFSNEAKQHLQAYATPEGMQKMGISMMWGTASAGDWVRAKALHEKYGGPIAISSFGACIAIKGRNALLKEYAAAGKIQFHDPEIEKLFWEGTNHPAVLDVTIRDPKRIANRFEKPPWQGWGARTAKLFKKPPPLLKTPESKQDSPTDAKPANKGGN